MSLRVLHLVATDARRGAEMFALDLTSALAARGVRQDVAIVRPSRHQGVPFTVPVWPLTPGSAASAKVGLRAALSLRNLTRRASPDVIQVHGGESLKVAAVAGLLGGPPIVYRRIGSAVGRSIGGLRRAAHGRLMSRADRVVAVADDVHRETVEFFGVPETKVDTIPNAVDAGRLKPTRPAPEIRRALGLGAGTKVVLSLGALTWEKDPLTHLAVTSITLSARTDLVHLIVGEGPLRGSLEDAVSKRSMDGRIRVLGARADVPDILSITDVMLVASATEGMPACVIEAGLAGIPVAGFDIAGMSELVVDGRSGLLAPVGDVAGLALRVERLLDDGDQMGAVAKRRCEEMFSIEAVVPRYLSIYEEEARRHRPRDATSDGRPA